MPCLRWHGIPDKSSGPSSRVASSMHRVALELRRGRQVRRIKAGRSLTKWRTAHRRNRLLQQNCQSETFASRSPPPRSAALDIYDVPKTPARLYSRFYIPTDQSLSCGRKLRPNGMEMSHVCAGCCCSGTARPFGAMDVEKVHALGRAGRRPSDF